MDMDDNNSSSMAMTFYSWNQYKTHIIFNSWNVDTKWEFALSWCSIVLFTVMYHAIKYMIILIEDVMFSNNNQYNVDSSSHSNPIIIKGNISYQQTPLNDPDEEAYNENCCSDQSQNSIDGNRNNVNNIIESPISFWRYLIMRTSHAALSGLNYGLALLLMFVAMTYNPSLFVALVFGYTLGDFLFFTRTKNIAQECH